MKKAQKVRQELKREVLSHYGGGRCGCVKCGQAQLECLSIDHIDGKGGRERAEKGIGNLYTWLKKGGYPAGYQTLCMNCQFIKRAEKNELRRDFSYRWTGERYPAYIGLRVSAILYSALRSQANDKGKSFSDYLRDCFDYIVKHSNTSVDATKPRLSYSKEEQLRKGGK